MKYALILILLSSAFSIPVTVERRALDFKVDHPSHRLGGKADPTGAEIWKAGAEFNISYLPAPGRFRISKAADSGMWSWDPLDTSSWVAWTKNKRSLNTDSLTEIAKALLPTYFPGTWEYEANRIDWTGGKASGLHVRFRRVFQGGILRGNLAYAVLIFDHRGKVTGTRFKSPTLTPITTSGEKVPLAEAMARAHRKLEKSEDKVRTDSLYPVSAKTKSVARAWQEVGGVLTPCYSFQTETTFKDGTSITEFLDEPLFRKRQKE
jgi:hypothetical protein